MRKIEEWTDCFLLPNISRSIDGWARLGNLHDEDFFDFRLNEWLICLGTHYDAILLCDLGQSLKDIKSNDWHCERMTDDQRIYSPIDRIFGHWAASSGDCARSAADQWLCQRKISINTASCDTSSHLWTHRQIKRLCAQCENGRLPAISFRPVWQTGQFSFLLFVE